MRQLFIFFFFDVFVSLATKCVLERNRWSCTPVCGLKDGFLGGGVSVANWRADDTQPAITEELMISVSRGSRSAEIAWRREEGRDLMQKG